MSSYFRNSILATIVYYDIFDYPLTPSEVHGNLINPARIMMIKSGIGEIDVNDINEELKKLATSQVIGEKNGFYFLGGRDELYETRTKTNQVADQKWKKFFKFTKFLALTPYLRGVFASGSLALGNTDEQSDFDVLIIARSGRLYTCRLFLWLITSLLGVRRKKHEKSAPDKFCFNHYITNDSLKLTHESLFNAQTYANLKPAMIGQEMVDEFYDSNLWLNNYLYNFQPQKDFARKNIKPWKLLLFVAGAFEWFFNSRLGDVFEKFVKTIQQKKIKNNPVTYESGGRIVFTDYELEFHPHSFEKFVIEKYNQTLNKLGVISYVKETDSGLLAPHQAHPLS
ncbi:MAG: hypothetical protein Q8Q89_04565 [bacterium]|nr:hypothetical protein [bacterium]